MNFERADGKRREVRDGIVRMRTLIEQLKISRCKGMLRCLPYVACGVPRRHQPLSLSRTATTHTNYSVSIHSFTATCTCLLLSLLPVPCVPVCQQTPSRRRRGSFYRAPCRPCGRPPSPPRDSCPSTSSSRRRRKRTTGWRCRPCHHLSLRLRPPLLLLLLLSLLLPLFRPLLQMGNNRGWRGVVARRRAKRCKKRQ